MSVDRSESIRDFAEIDEFWYDGAMKSQEVIDILRRNADTLRERGVKHAALFGSVARGDAGPESDIDILIDLDRSVRLGVFGYVELKSFIEELVQP